MIRHTLHGDMFHDEVIHEGMRKAAFLFGLVAAIILLHRVLYHMPF